MKGARDWSKRGVGVGVGHPSVRNSSRISWTSLFVVVVVVVVETVVRAGILSHLMVSLSELGEHRNDASQHCLTLRVLRGSQSFAGFETVLNRCVFQRRTASDREEAAPIGSGPLMVALGDVQRDRLRGMQQLVPRGPLLARGHLVCLSHIPDRNPVDIELLMPEWHFFSDYDNDNDNDNVCIPFATYC
jgi:hypothetical protein